MVVAECPMVGEDLDWLEMFERGPLERQLKDQKKLESEMVVPLKGVMKGYQMNLVWDVEAVNL